jgi:hypothetical protein
MRSRLLLLLSLLPLCLVLAERRALSAVPKPSNELHEALDRWVTDYRRGSFGEFLQGKNMRRYRPYLTMELVARTDRIGRPTRLLEEVEVLVQLAREGGDYEDGKLLVEALLHEERKAPKKGASPSFWVRQMLHRSSRAAVAPDGIQSAFMDRLQEGLRETGDTYTHRDPRGSATPPARAGELPEPRRAPADGASARQRADRAGGGRRRSARSPGLRSRAAGARQATGPPRRRRRADADRPARCSSSPRLRLRPRRNATSSTPSMSRSRSCRSAPTGGPAWH